MAANHRQTIVGHRRRIERYLLACGVRKPHILRPHLLSPERDFDSVLRAIGDDHTATSAIVPVVPFAEHARGEVQPKAGTGFEQWLDPRIAALNGSAGA